MASAFGLDAREHWDHTSRYYDRQLWLERSAVSLAVRMLATRRTDRCLDLGTGTGEVLRHLARQTAAPERVTGIDISPRMLERVSTLPVGWELALGDIRALPVADHAFDAATASYLLHLLPLAHLPLALSEVGRALRPGGRLVTVTPAVPPQQPTRVIGTLLDRTGRRWPARVGGLRALDPRPALAECGFEPIHSRWSVRGYPSLVVLCRT